MTPPLTVPTLKARFLKFELGLLTFRGALSTRDAEWPIYHRSKREHQRTRPQKALRNLLMEIETRYASRMPSEQQHVEFIERTCDSLSKEFEQDLFRGRFRIGVGQKLINLHLKYLWVADAIAEPPHCPIDGIIREKAALEFNWTSNDSIQDYKAAIIAVREAAKPDSLAVWELREFKRKAEQ